MRNSRALALPSVAVVAASLAVVLTGARPAGASTATPVLEKRIIGYSVLHRPIVAYHLGNPRIKRTMLILGEMHGNEHAGVRVVRSIIRRKTSIEGLNLWVIPTVNPDGDARHTRGNAHHVDLNRNWPHHWKHLTGQYYSGPRVRSEPETRAMYTFLKHLRPHYLVSLHQPLHGVDATDGARLDKAFRNRLAHNLGYPIKAFNCWSVCHGSMTPWFTKHRYGLGFTVEFGWHPSKHMVTKRAPRAIIHAMGGRFGSLARHNPRTSLQARPSPGHVAFRGWAYDTDGYGVHVPYRAYRDGHLIRTAKASSPSPLLNAKYGLVGAHSYAFTDAPAPGRHTYCLVFTNIRAGTASPKVCRTVTVPAA